MKKKIAMEWADALESGLYKKGTGQLRAGDKFCCLGVLCNLHAIKHPKIAEKQTKTSEYLGKYGFTPTLVMKWAGLNTERGIYDTYDNSLVRLNDSSKSFKHLAEVIRENWKEL